MLYARILNINNDKDKIARILFLFTLYPRGFLRVSEDPESSLKIMPRLAGVNIPENKQIAIALTHIFGIGFSSSRKILTEAGIKPNIKASQLSPAQVNQLKEIIEKKYKIEGELKRNIIMNIKRLKDIGAWRGVRHLKRLPVRGQRTKTNTRTIRGNVRKTVGSGRKPAPGLT